MATTTDIASKAAKYREMAKDKALPQDVRNAYLDKANKLEESTMKPTMAKGGDVKKVKMAVGGDVSWQANAQAAMDKLKQQQVKSDTKQQSQINKAEQAAARKQYAAELKRQTMAAPKQVATKAPMPVRGGSDRGGMGAGLGGGGDRGGMGGGFAKGGAVVAKAPAKKPAMKGPAVVIAVGMTKKPTKMNYGGMAAKQPMMSKGGMAKGKC